MASNVNDEQHEYFKLLFQTSASEPSKGLETEALQTRIRGYFTQFLDKARVPGNDAALQEAHTAALAVQHGIDDLSLISMSTNAAVHASRNEGDRTLQAASVHPAWKTF